MLKKMIDAETIRIATDQARFCSTQPDPRAAVVKTSWCSLQLLYAELVKSKEIKPVNDLSHDKKTAIWKEVCAAIPEASKYRKLWTAQALYMYELLNSK